MAEIIIVGINHRRDHIVYVFDTAREVHVARSAVIRVDRTLDLEQAKTLATSRETRPTEGERLIGPARYREADLPPPTRP